MSQPTVHLICNAHLDPVWLWEWEEGAAAAVSTFRTAADLCEEFPGFIFNHNEAILYQWVEEYEPELFARIQRLVNEGKWHIMGGWHLQPDCNMPSGESFIRQILLGRSYFQGKFGVQPTTAINFDPFGHTRGLVQILAKSGFDSYMICRPGAGDLKLESDCFAWVGFDGSQITVARVPNYGSSLGGARGKVEAHLQSMGDLACSTVLWGVGNHGGGPSRKDLRDLAALIGECGSADIRHSTPEAYFAELAKDGKTLPRVERDLNPWAVGCYTSQIRIKQKQRHLENEIYSLEKMASSAAAQKLMPYPAQEIKEALKDLATCQFHDILPGSSIQPVEEMSLRKLDHGLELVSRAKARAFFALASGQTPANPHEIPILVYNPHPFRTRAVIECEFQLEDSNWKSEFTSTPVYQGDQRLPSQNEKEDSNLNLDWRKRVVFLADLEPSQMNRFDCRLEILPERPPVSLSTSGDAIVFRTEELEVIVNTQSGLIDRYRAHGVDYTGANASEPLVIADDEDPWGMRTHSYREVIGRFHLMSPEDGARFSGVTEGPIPSVRVVEDGPVRAVVEAVFEYNHSAICQRYLLPKTGTELEVSTRVHWNEKNRMLKLSIPTPFGVGRYRGQVACGVEELPTNGDEAVAQKWVAVMSQDGERALTCINDGVYGSDCSEDGLRLTLLRSPAYSGHPIMERPLVPQDRYLPRIDQGERLYRFWLNGGSASERFARVDREALVKNEKPFVLSFFPSGAGSLPKSFAALSDEVVQVMAIKKAEDNDDIIIRLFEPTGQSRTTLLTLPCYGLEQEITLSAFEIKTLRADPQTRAIREVSLLEKPIG